MAKVIVEFDTKEHILNVSMDGVSMSNVKGVEFYEDYEEKDEFHMHLRMSEKFEDDDMVKVMIVNAQDELVEDKLSVRKRLAKCLFPEQKV